MSRRMHYLRALGWSAFAAAPPLLVALAVISSRPQASPSLVTNTAIAAWIAGTLAFGASMIHQRGGRRAAWIAGGLSAFVALAVTAALIWAAVVLGAPVAALDERDRAELEVRTDDSALVHPHLGFALPSVPDGMEPASGVRAQAEAAGGAGWAEAHHVWAWEGRGAEVVVDLARAPRADAAALAQVVGELESAEGLRETARTGLEARLEAPVQGGGHALARVILFEHDGRAYRLLITVVTRDRDRWDQWLAGVRAPS